MWVEFVVGSLPLLREVFLLSSPENQHFQFQFDQESAKADEGPLRGCTTSESLFIIHLFI